MKKKEQRTEDQGAKQLFGTAAIMAVIITVSKLLGLVRDRAIAGAYGTTEAAQAYTIASKLPINIFDLVIGGVVTAAFVPTFSALLVKKDREKAMSFANSYVNLILIITAVISALGIALSSLLVRFLAPEASESVLSLASQLTKIMFPMIMFTGLAFSFVGILQSLGEFRIPALISLVSNAIMVIYLYSLNRFFGIFGLAAAMLLGWASQAFVQAPKLRALGYRYSPKLDLRSPEIKRALLSAIPILIGTWTQPFCSLINTIFVSGMNEGRAISAIDYANKLYIIVVGIFSFVATNLLFPYMSRANAAGRRDEARRMTAVSIKVLVFIIAPIAVGIAILSSPFCALIYQHGEFNASDTALTAEALRCFAVGMLFMAVNEVLVKMFFSDSRTVIPMISSLVSIAVNITAVVTLHDKIGVGGIALISGIATGVSCLINYLVMRRDGRIFSIRDGVDLLRSLLCAAAMGAGVWWVSRLLEGKSDIIVLAACGAAGVAIYAILAVVTRSDEVSLFISKILKKEKTEK